MAKRLQEFSKNLLRVSPDGRLLCFESWDARYPIMPVEVYEMDSWKMIFSGMFQTRAWAVSFFSDSKRFIVTTHGDHTLVDLQTGARIEGWHLPDNPYEEGYGKEPLFDNIILIKHMDYKNIMNCSLVLAEFPSYREIVKVPFVIKSDDPGKMAPADTRNCVSVDRKIFVYFYGRTLVCRRTKDLEVLWIRKIEPPVKACEIESPNENYVAVAFADKAWRSQQKESYICVYNAKTGSEIARLPIFGGEGIALSPDGNLIAVEEVRHEYDRRRNEYIVLVHIYDVKSGRVLASIEHEREKPRRLHVARCTLHFTADGRYLISSGDNARIWKVTPAVDF